MKQTMKQTMKTNKRLYESIMKDISKIVKNKLFEHEYFSTDMDSFDLSTLSEQQIDDIVNAIINSIKQDNTIFEYDMDDDNKYLAHVYTFIDNVDENDNLMHILDSYGIMLEFDAEIDAEVDEPYSSGDRDVPDYPGSVDITDIKIFNLRLTDGSDDNCKEIGTQYKKQIFDVFKTTEAYNDLLDTELDPDDFRYMPDSDEYYDPDF